MAAAPSRGDDHHHHGSRGGTSTSQHPAHSQHASAASVQLGRFVLWSLVEGGAGGGAAAAAANDTATQPHSDVTSVAALAEPFTPPRATGGGPTQAGAGGGLRSSPIDLAKDLIRAKPRIPEPMALMQGRERSVMGAIPDVPTTVERRARRRLHQQPDQQHRGFATTPPTRRKVAAAAAATANNTTTPQPQPPAPAPAALSTLHNQSAYDLPAARAIDDALGMLRDIAKLKGRAAQMLRTGRREDAATLGAAIEKTSAVVRERVKEARAAVRADAAQHLSTKEQLESAIRNMETERAITAREHAAAVAALEDRIGAAAAAAQASEVKYANVLKEESVNATSTQRKLEMSFKEQLDRAMQESEALKRLEVSAAEERIARRLDSQYREDAHAKEVENARLKAKCESMKSALEQVQSHAQATELELEKVHERLDSATAAESAIREQLARREMEARDATNLLREETERTRSDLAAVQVPIGEMRDTARKLHVRLSTFGAECGIATQNLDEAMEEPERKESADASDIGEATAQMLVAVANAVGETLGRTAEALKQMESRHTELTSQLADATKRAEDLEHERARAESLAAAQESRAKTAEEQMQKHHGASEAVRVELTNQLEEAKATTRALESRARAEMAKVRSERDVAKEEGARAISDRDATVESASASAVTAARERLELTTKLRKAESEAMSATEALADVEARHARAMTAAQAEVAAARADAQRSHGDAEAASRALVEKDEEMQNRVAHVEKLTSSRAEKLAAEADGLRLQVRAAKTESEAAIEELKKYKRRCVALKAAGVLRRAAQKAAAERMRAEAEKQAGAAEFAQMGTVAQRKMVEEQKRAIVGLQQAHSEEMAHLSSELELVRGEAARRERALADTVGKSESKCAELQASLSGVEAERHRLQVEVESFRCSKETLAKRLDSVEQARASAVAAQDAASATQARIAATWQSERDGLRSKIAECEEARLMAEQQSTSLSVTCAQLEQRASRLEQDLVKTKEYEAREAEDFKNQLASAEQHLDKIQLEHTTHVAELKQELLKTQTALASSEHTCKGLRRRCVVMRAAGAMRLAGATATRDRHHKEQAEASEQSLADARDVFEEELCRLRHENDMERANAERLQRSLEATVHRGEASAMAADQRYRALVVDKEKLEWKQSSIEAQLLVAKDKAATAERDLQAFSTSAAAAAESAAAELSAVEGRAAHAEQNLKRLEATHEHTAATLAEAKSRLDTVMGELKGYRRRAVALRAASVMRRAAASAAIARVQAESEEGRMSAEREIQMKNEEHEQLMSSMRELDAKASAQTMRLESQLADERASNSKMAAQLQNELAETRRRVDEEREGLLKRAMASAEKSVRLSSDTAREMKEQRKNNLLIMEEARSAFEEERTRLVSELEVARLDIARLRRVEAEVTAQKERVEHLESARESVASDLHRAKFAADAAERRCKAAEAARAASDAALKAEREARTGADSTNATELSRLRTLHAALADRDDESRSRASDLQEKLDLCTKEIGNVRAELSLAKDERKHLRRRVVFLSAASAMRRSADAATLRLQTDETNVALQDASEAPETQQLVLRMRALEASYAQESTRAAAELEMARTDVKMAEKRGSMFADELERLRLDLRRSNDNVAKLERTIAAAKRQAEDRHAELLEARADAERARSDASNANTSWSDEKNALVASVQVAEQKLASAQAGHRAASERMSSELRAAVSAANDSRMESRRYKRRLVVLSAVSAMQRASAKSSANVRSPKQRNAAAAIDAVETESRESRDTELSELSMSLELERTELSQLTSMLREAETAKGDALARLQVSQEKAEEERMRMEASLDVLQKSYQSLGAKLAAVEASRAGALADRSRLEVRLESQAQSWATEKELIESREAAASKLLAEREDDYRMEVRALEQKLALEQANTANAMREAKSLKRRLVALRAAATMRHAATKASGERGQKGLIANQQQLAQAMDEAADETRSRLLMELSMERAEIKRVRREMDRASSEAAEEHQKLRAEVASATRRIQMLEQESERSERAMRRLEARANVSDSELSRAMADRDEHASKLLAEEKLWHAERDGMQTRLSNCDRMLEENRARQDELQRKLNDATRAAKEAEDRLHSAQDTARSGDSAEAQGSDSGKISALERELADVRRELTDALAASDGMTPPSPPSAFVALERELAATKRELANVRTDAADAQTADVTKVAALERELAAVRRELTEALAASAGVTPPSPPSAFVALERELAATKRELSNVRAARPTPSSPPSAFAALENELATVRRELTDARAAAADAQNTDAAAIAKLKRELADARGAAADAQTTKAETLEALENELADARHELADVRASAADAQSTGAARVVSLENELANARREMADTRAASILNAQTADSARIVALESELADARRELADALAGPREKLLAAISEARMYKRQCAALSAAGAMRQMALREVSERRQSALEHALSDAREQAEGIATEQRALLDMLDSFDGDGNGTIPEDLVRKTREFATNAMNLSWKHSLEIMELRIEHGEAMRELNTNSVEELNNLRSDLQIARVECMSLRKSLVETENSSGATDEVVVSLRRELDAARSRVQELQDSASNAALETARVHSELNESLAASEKRVSAAEAAAENARSELNSLRTQAKEQHKQLEMDVKSYRRRVVALNAAGAMRRAAADASMKREKERLASAMNASSEEARLMMTQHLEAMITAQNAHHTEEKRLSLALAAAQDEAARLREELSAHTKLSSDELASLREDRDRAQKALKELTVAKDAAEVRHSDALKLVLAQLAQSREVQESIDEELASARSALDGIRSASDHDSNAWRVERTDLLEQLAARGRLVQDRERMLAAQLGAMEQALLAQLLAADEKRCGALERMAAGQSHVHERHIGTLGEASVSLARLTDQVSSTVEMLDELGRRELRSWRRILSTTAARVDKVLVSITAVLGDVNRRVDRVEQSLSDVAVTVPRRSDDTLSALEAAMSLVHGYDATLRSHLASLVQTREGSAGSNLDVDELLARRVSCEQALASRLSALPAATAAGIRSDMDALWSLERSAMRAQLQMAESKASSLSAEREAGRRTPRSAVAMPSPGRMSVEASAWKLERRHLYASLARELERQPGSMSPATLESSDWQAERRHLYSQLAQARRRLDEGSTKEAAEPLPAQGVTTPIYTRATSARKQQQHVDSPATSMRKLIRTTATTGDDGHQPESPATAMRSLLTSTTKTPRNVRVVDNVNADEQPDSPATAMRSILRSAQRPNGGASPSPRVVRPSSSERPPRSPKVGATRRTTATTPTETSKSVRSPPPPIPTSRQLADMLAESSGIRSGTAATMAAAAVVSHRRGLDPALRDDSITSHAAVRIRWADATLQAAHHTPAVFRLPVRDDSSLEKASPVEVPIRGRISQAEQLATELYRKLNEQKGPKSLERHLKMRKATWAEAAQNINATAAGRAFDESINLRKDIREVLESKFEVEARGSDRGKRHI